MNQTFSKEEIKDLINNDIDDKIYFFSMSEQFDYTNPPLLRSQLRLLIEKTVEAWGFVPADIVIIGPNEDKEIDIRWHLMLPFDGKNTITGAKMI